jgi:hypothetical protein
VHVGNIANINNEVDVLFNGLLYNLQKKDLLFCAQVVKRSVVLVLLAIITSPRLIRAVDYLSKPEHHSIFLFFPILLERVQDKL